MRLEIASPDLRDPYHVAITKYSVRAHGAVGPDVRFWHQADIKALII
jgi:hypothetical protein